MGAANIAENNYINHETRNKNSKVHPKYGSIKNTTKMPADAFSYIILRALENGKSRGLRYVRNNPVFGEFSFWGIG